MFPNTFRSKRAKLALRFFTYGVMTLATVVLTTLAIFWAMGYRFNNATLEQGGLVQFRSTPEGATVVVDGVVQNFKTPGRANLPSGVHTIVMQLDGNREWRRTVTVAPGQLLWLNYTRFIPNSVTTAPMKTFAGLSGSLASPDRRWMLFHEKADSPIVTIADFNNEKDPIYNTLTLPDGKVSKTADGKYGLLGMTEWDLGSRYFLMHQQNGATHEWLRVDRTKAEDTVNLSQLFKMNITDAHFAGNNPNILYVLTDGTLRRLDIGSNSVSAALVNDVQSFIVYGDGAVSYIAKRRSNPNDAATTQQAVGVYKDGKETVVRTYAPEAPVKIAYGKYDTHSFLAIHKGDGIVQILRDPSENSQETEFAEFALDKNADWLKMSNNGRMVTAGAGSSVVTFDLELNRPYESNLPFLSGSNARPMQWLDDYYLWSDNGGKLRLVEFDGQNDREITTVAPGFGITLSQSGKTLFSIGKNEITGSYFLQGSQIVK
ncbi:MAG TPA: PEGA domain-containing protein [Candidatus Saccharimonadales bacterium]|nr:PEGA domain-containing protein [Candidatus Saccharimonadales bacterium]